MEEGKVLTVDQIAKNLSSEVFGQPIYKCKIVFLDVDRKSDGYVPMHRFSANYHDYAVRDDGISYLPEEAYSALNGAVSYISRPKTKKQAQEGVDVDDPNDRYEKVKVKRFDVTVLDIIKLVTDEKGNRRFVSSNEQVTEEENIATKKVIEIKVRQEMEENFAEERLAYAEKIKALEAKLLDAAPAEDIDELIKDE